MNMAKDLRHGAEDSVDRNEVGRGRGWSRCSGKWTGMQEDGVGRDGRELVGVGRGGKRWD